MKKSELVLRAMLDGCEYFEAILKAVGLTRMQTRNAIGNLRARHKVYFVKEEGRNRYIVRPWAKESQ